MSQLIPTGGDNFPVNRIRSPWIMRQTSRNLDKLEARTLLRAAAVRAEGLIQTEKLKEIDFLTREAMGGQALLGEWRKTLAGNDPALYDELKFFTDAARLGKGEIIADTIDSFCRESRRS